MLFNLDQNLAFRNYKPTAKSRENEMDFSIKRAHVRRIFLSYAAGSSLISCFVILFYEEYMEANKFIVLHGKWFDHMERHEIDLIFVLR